MYELDLYIVFIPAAIDGLVMPATFSPAKEDVLLIRFGMPYELRWLEAGAGAKIVGSFSSIGVTASDCFMLVLREPRLPFVEAPLLDCADNDRTGAAGAGSASPPIFGDCTDGDLGGPEVIARGT